MNDAYTVLLREKKLPMALLEDPEAKAAAAGKSARASLVQTQPFAATFGVKHTRKRPKLAADSLADLVSTADRINATCVPAAAGWLTCCCVSQERALSKAAVPDVPRRSWLNVLVMSNLVGGGQKRSLDDVRRKVQVCREGRA